MSRLTHMLFDLICICCLTIGCWLNTLCAVQPNIVILLADDLGYGELGCQGNRQIPTPHIDSIANNGVRFTDGYVSAAYCSASRAGLMTGKYQSRFGYDFNPIGAKNESPNAGLPTSQKTLATRLRALGYATGLIGKWHLGGTARYHPNRRGFDEFFGFTHEGHFFEPLPYRGTTTMLRRKVLPGKTRGRWTAPDGKLILTSHMGHDEPSYDANNPIVRQSQPVNEPAYLTDAFTREAVDFIDRNKSRPFFLYLAYNAVHSPLQGADKYMQRFASIDDVHRRIFAAMLSNLDDSVGEVLDKLKRDRLLDNTLVFFLSDNGGPTRELTSSNLPLRGEKGRVYEGGLRVPMMCQWPGRLPQGRVYSKPVISLDITATALTLAMAHSSKTSDSNNSPDTIDIPNSNMNAALSQMDGVDLMPFITADESERTSEREVSVLVNADSSQPHRELFWRMGNRAALRSDDWKVVRDAPSQGSQWELFHLGNDLSEQHDLSESQPVKLKELVSRWNELNSEMQSPIRW